jgi:hypothetical protein
MVNTIDSSRSRMKVTQFTCGLVVFVMAHVAYTFVFYRARVLTHSSIASSDFLLFGLPAIFAFTGYYFLLRARAVRMIPPSVAALLLTFVSFSLSLLLPFNVYGT